MSSREQVNHPPTMDREVRCRLGTRVTLCPHASLYKGKYRTWVLASSQSCDLTGSAVDLQPSVATARILTDANHDGRHQVVSCNLCCTPPEWTRTFVLTFPRHTQVALDWQPSQSGRKCLRQRIHWLQPCPDGGDPYQLYISLHVIADTDQRLL